MSSVTASIDQVGASPINIQWKVVRGDSATLKVEFLEDDDKVKLSLLMKGRQMAMKANGEMVMLKFAQLVEELGIPEALPKLEGNRWNMIIKPKKK